MPGGHSWVFPGCTTSQSKKYKDINLFKLPARACDSEWKKKLVDVIKKYRVVDRDLNERIASSKVYICEHHFIPSDIEFTSKLFFRNLLKVAETRCCSESKFTSKVSFHSLYNPSKTSGSTPFCNNIKTTGEKICLQGF